MKSCAVGRAILGGCCWASSAVGTNEPGTSSGAQRHRTTRFGRTVRWLGTKAVGIGPGRTRLVMIILTSFSLPPLALVTSIDTSLQQTHTSPLYNFVGGVASMALGSLWVLKKTL